MNFLKKIPAWGWIVIGFTVWGFVIMGGLKLIFPNPAPKIVTDGTQLNNPAGSTIDTGNGGAS